MDIMDDDEALEAYIIQKKRELGGEAAVQSYIAASQHWSEYTKRVEESRARDGVLKGFDRLEEALIQRRKWTALHLVRCAKDLILASAHIDNVDGQDEIEETTLFKAVNLIVDRWGADPEPDPYKEIEKELGVEL